MLSHIQLGKNGVTENFLKTLNNHFVNSDNVKISVLKASGRDREKIREMSNLILSHLGKNYTAKIVGFTIILKKWRKAQR